MPLRVSLFVMRVLVHFFAFSVNVSANIQHTLVWGWCLDV